jgi:hypothetical protein
MSDMGDISSGGLFVTHDYRLFGAQIVRVAASDDGGVTVDYVAANGSCFAPDDADAGSDGWVRDLTRITGTLSFTLPAGELAGSVRDLLVRFERHACVVEMHFDVARQHVAIYDRAGRQGVIISMPDELLDRAP